MSALERALQEEGLLNTVLEGCNQTGLSITEFLKNTIVARAGSGSSKVCAECNDGTLHTTINGRLTNMQLF